MLARDLDGSKVDVALILPSLRGGGAERVTVTLANYFARKGLNVDLVLASAEGAYLPDVDSLVRVIDLKSRRMVMSIPGILRYLRKEEPRSILSAMNYVNVITIFSRILSRVSSRLVVVEHSNLSSTTAVPQSRRVRFVAPLMRFFYPHADVVVAVSNGVADDLSKKIKFPREKIRVIYNPVVNADLVEKSNAAISHPWIESKEFPLVLAAGRLNPAKDYSTLLRAFALAKRQKRCRLIILGEGPLRESLQALAVELNIEEDVQFLGFSSNPYAWMKHSSVFVLSSAWEGLPTVLIEAMACGAQVISTDCPSGPSEILEDGKWGRMVPVGDAVALAEQIVQGLTEIHPLDGRLRASYFSVDKAIDGYLMLLLGVADSRKHPHHV